MELYWRERISSKKSKVKRVFKTFFHAHKNEGESINFPPGIFTEANDEDATAQLEFGKILINASSVQNNCDKAFSFISRSAKQGNMEAQFRLGDVYALGHGTSKSPSDAYKWYTKSAIQGYKKALIRIHNLYQEDMKMHCRGQINSEEEEWATDDFKKENKIRELNEYRLEQNQLFLNGAISYYTKQFKIHQSANQEDPSTQLSLAFHYQHGYGVKKCIKWAFEYYKMAAEKGNTDAQYNLGDLYRKHTNMKFNYRDAFKWLTKSAQGGNRVAQRSLAYFYLKGLATDIDYDVALIWYTKAAEAGDTEAMASLGKLYRKGDYIKHDLSMAAHWYTLAARHGNIVAQNCLSQLHQQGMLNNIHLDEDMLDYLTEPSMNQRLCTKLSKQIYKLEYSPKIKQLEDLAKRALIGDGQAMYEIGLKYLKGDDGFIQEEDTGMKWIKNAAVAKHRDARLLVADLYKKGDSVEQDYHKSAIWYRKLAKQKDTVAQCNVGVMYNEGLGVRKDPLEASKWFIWAADRGNSDAQFSLSMLRFEGAGLHKDEEEGLKWLHESVLQRNIQSCYSLGRAYLKCQYNLQKNTKWGLLLLEFAAKNGLIQAQLELGYMYRHGDEVETHKQKSIKYFTMAKDADCPNAHYQLGIMYLKRKSYITAYKFFKQAKEKDHTEAKRIFETPIQYDSSILGYFELLTMFVEATKHGIDDLQYSIGLMCEDILRNPKRDYFWDSSIALDAEEWYLAASKNGDSRADFRLGQFHEHGYSIRRSMHKAKAYYKRALTNGHSDACYRIACMYLHGYGVRQNLSKAFYYYTKASNMGHQQARQALIISGGNNDIIHYGDYLYEKSSSIWIEIAKVDKVKMLERVTEKGYIRLHYRLGVMYDDDHDAVNAFKWLSVAADDGITDAYYRVGVLYEEGRGVEQDYAMAAEMYHNATKNEHENAYYRLGRLYQYGNGVKLNYLKAYQLYKKAADMGHVEAYKVLNITSEPNTTDLNGGKDVEEYALDSSSQKYQDSLLMFEYVAEYGDTDAQFKVGFVNEFSISEPNYAKAYEWYSLAAKESHREAIYHLGLLHEKGLGILQDHQKTIQLYEQAGQLGSDTALYRLGHVYHQGNGVEIDSGKAIEYYTLSAKLGNIKGQCELGKLYDIGEIVEKNPLEVLRWYTRAYLQGYDPIAPQLYRLYQDQPYEEFFFKKLFRNLSVASCGHFRLNDDYHYSDYGDINIRLGILSALEYGTDKDVIKANTYFTKEYTFGDNFPFEAIDILSLGYGLNSIDKARILEAFEADEAFMKQVDKQSLYKLGMFFFDGGAYALGDTYIDDEGLGDINQYLVIDQEYSRAFKYLKMAADKSHPEALFQLGIMYHCGYGVTRDLEQSKRCFDDAANKDIKLARRIATLYHTSEKMKNFEDAFKWYSLLENMKLGDCFGSRQQGIYEQVQLGLGLLYEYGDGVDQSYKKALVQYTRLAEVGFAVGIHRMALMYYYGKGIGTDYEISFNLFEEAVDSKGWGAELPYVYVPNIFNVKYSPTNLVYCVLNAWEVKGESHYYLGLQYKNGRGVTRDHKKAQYHFVKAFEFKCKRAKHEIEDYKPKGLMNMLFK